jgi:hypothetical protein
MASFCPIRTPVAATLPPFAATTSNWRDRQSRSTYRCRDLHCRAPRKIAPNGRLPRNCLRMIRVCSRFDSQTFTPGGSAIGTGINFSRCPVVAVSHVRQGGALTAQAIRPVIEAGLATHFDAFEERNLDPLAWPGKVVVPPWGRPCLSKIAQPPGDSRAQTCCGWCGAT